MSTTENTVDSEPASVTPGVQNTVDVRNYWRIIVRRRWVILGAFIAVSALSAAYTLRLPKVYAAMTTIVIEMTAPKILGNGQVQDVAESSTPYWYSKEYYETQYNVLRSRAVGERVANLLRSGRDDKLLSLDLVQSADAREKGLKALENLRAQMAQRQDPASLVMGRIGVEPVKDSRVTRLTYEDSDPLLAAALVNTYAQAYMEHNLASKSLTTSEATESLELRLPDLDGKVQASAQEIADYKKKHNIGGSFEERQKLSLERVTRLSQELTNVQIKKATMKARNEAISNLRKAPQVDEVQRSALVPQETADLLRNLQIKLIELKNECDELESRMLAQHPKLVDCRVKLGNIERAYQREIDTVLGRAQADYANVADTERNLLVDLNLSKKEAEELSGLEPDYLRLKRAHETNLRLYDVALKSLKETGLSGTTRLNNVSLLDAARPNLSPAKPNVRNNLLVGFALALVLGIALAFGLELLDNTVTSQEQIEERFGISFLGIIPSFNQEKGVPHSDLLVHEQPKSAAAECCRAIRTNLLFMSPERPLKSFVVTSGTPRDGKTTTAASLAITMAESGNRVLLVDADMRRPRVHSAFKIANGAGLSSLILGEGTLKAAVKSSGVPNLSLLTAGPIPPNPAELLHTQGFKNVLDQMTTEFDRVIIDSPPVAAVADALVISTQVDGTVLVVKSGSTSKDMAARTVRALRDIKARIFGAILNDVDLGDRQGGGYYYYSKYGYYYGESDPKDKAAAS